MFTPLTPAKIKIQHAPLRVQNSDYDDIYFSNEDAVAESIYNYIDGNALPKRFSTWKKPFFCIGELGFGTGLNAFLAIETFRRHRHPALKKLYYLATELHPISITDLRQIHQHWQSLLGFTTFSEQLLAHYPPALSGVHHLYLGDDVELILLWGDSLEQLKHQQATIDAWFLDGFAPSKNPDQWSQSLCQEIARLSQVGTTVAAFSCARMIKDSLKRVGVTINKRAGFGRKRDMLTGIFNDNLKQVPDPITFPQWAASPCLSSITSASTNAEALPKHVTLIGAGLASAFTARHLAELGVAVTVLTDKQNFADVLPCAALHLHLSTAENLKRDIDLAAYHLAIQTYQEIDMHFSIGLYEYDDIMRQKKLLAQPCHQGVLKIDGGATHYPKAGAIKPQQVIEYCFRHENIEIKFEHDVQHINHEEQTLDVLCRKKQLSLRYSQLVVCTGATTSQLIPLLAHISKPIRGQLSRFLTREMLPNAILCHNTLQVPLKMRKNQGKNGQYFAGGTYDLHDPRPIIKPADNISNLSAVLAHNAAHTDDILLDAWAGLRLSSNDTLPFISPLPDVAAYANEYQHLQHHATRPVTTPATYQNNIFINTGYGSKGTLYAPLAAKIIAHYLLGTPAPLPAKHLASLHLGRFVVRHLARRTIATLLHN